MTHKIDDAVRETFATAGTGDITLLGATSGVGARGVASALSNGDTTWMTFAKGSQREEAFVTYTAPATITRTTTYRSTNSDNAVDFGIGEGEAFIDIPAKVLSGVFNNGTGEQINLKTVATGTNFKTGTLVERLGLADTFLKAGRQGQTSPGIFVDFSAASCVTGLKIAAAAAGAGLALSVISSASNENLMLNALGTGTIAIGSVSTGRVTITPVTTITGALTLSAALTYGGVTLSNAVTGTGNMVLSASPTFTGTITAAIANFSGAVTFAADPTVSYTNNGTTIGAKQRLLFINPTTTANAGSDITWAAADTTTGRWAAITGEITSNSSNSATGDISIATKNAVSDTTLTKRLTVAAAGVVTVTSSTASSSTTTGALVVTGGVGVGGAVIAGGVIGTTTSDPVGARANGIVMNQGGGSAIFSRGPSAWELGRSDTSGFHLLFYTDNGSAFVAAGGVSSSGSTTTYTTVSDERLKMLFDEDGIDWGERIDRLWVGAFQMKADPGQWRLGIRAQQAHGIVPQGVTRPRAENKDDLYRVDYGLALAPLAIWGVKDLRLRAASLEAQSQNHGRRIAALERRMAA